jgi:2'-5' RNA ligase
MKATFALLANAEIHNLIRKLSWNIHRKYHTELDVCRLPPHISLKQPFEISALEPLEEYMNELAKSIEPFEAHLTQLDLISTKIDEVETGILWLDVQETEILRQLHNRINTELIARFGNVPAAFDGPEYHFHMSVAIGGQPLEVYKKAYNDFSDRLKDIHYLVRELVMFVYDERQELNAGYMTYAIVPLGLS